MNYVNTTRLTKLKYRQSVLIVLQYNTHINVTRVITMSAAGNYRQN